MKSKQHVFISILLIGAISFSFGTLQAKGTSHSKLKPGKASRSSAEPEEADFDMEQFREVKQIVQEWDDQTNPVTSAQDHQVHQADSGSDEEKDSTSMPMDAETQKAMNEVTEATLKYLPSDGTDENPIKDSEIEKYRVCPGDQYNPDSQEWEEDTSESCILPKLSIAARLFNIRYSFAKCIFEKENPASDRLAERGTGHGLAQIVNETMRDIDARWNREDQLAYTLQHCLALISNRDEVYRLGIDTLSIPTELRDRRLRTEAIRSAPTTLLNPLYRDDAICLGVMTMAIKVKEARASKSKGTSDYDLARRYNTSELKESYAADIVSCIGKQPAKDKGWGGFFGFIKIPEIPFLGNRNKNK